MTNLLPIERLKNMGFRQVGEWTLDSGKVQFTLDDVASSQNVLYAFISEDTVMYIGKTVQTLKQRMNGYKNPASTQSTNIKGNNFITETLTVNKPVSIFALPDNGLLYYGGFHVNLAAGLEDSLVSSLKPSWNKAGV
jgi:hypothetical protein